MDSFQRLVIESICPGRQNGFKLWMAYSTAEEKVSHDKQQILRLCKLEIGTVLQAKKCEN